MKLKTIRAKLLAAFLSLVVVVGVVGFFGLRGMSSLDKQLEEAATNLIPSLGALSRAQEGLLASMFNTRNGELGMRDQDLAVARNQKVARDGALARADKALAAYAALPMQPEEKRTYDDFKAAEATWRQVNEAQWAAILAADLPKVKQLKPEATRLVATARGHLARLVELQDKYAAEAHKAGQDAASSATTALWIAMALAALAAMTMALLITRAIANPVRAIRDVAVKIAKGDLKQRVEHQGSDEVGDLAESFRSLLAYVQGVAAAADAIAHGDLTKNVEARSAEDVLSQSVASVAVSLRSLQSEVSRLTQAAKSGELSTRAAPEKVSGAYAELLRGVNDMLDDVLVPVNEAVRVLETVAERDLRARMKGDYRGDHARLKNALNSAVENLDQGLGQVATATHEVRSASTQIASASQSLSSGASEQASSLAETRSSLEEMSSTTQRNAESAQSANDLAVGASSASDRGASSMKEMLDAMRKIRGSAESTAEIIRDINEIAFQTNLLALNAAVEAARAGDAGRGFAVVADEVRSLAMRAKEAAKKTESLIHESVQLAASGEQISNDVGQSLGAIVSSVGEVTTIVGNIATASGEQSRGIEQVTTAVTQMDQVTQQNAAGAEELSSTAEELSAQAEELAGLVSRFQLSNAMAMAARQAATPARPAPARVAAAAPRHAAEKVAAASIKAKPANAPLRAVKGTGTDPLPMGDDAFNDF